MEVANMSPRPGLDLVLDLILIADIAIEMDNQNGRGCRYDLNARIEFNIGLGFYIADIAIEMDVPSGRDLVCHYDPKAGIGFGIAAIRLNRATVLFAN